MTTPVLPADNRRPMSRAFSVFLGLSTMAIVATSSACAQDKARISGRELQQWISKYYVVAGTNDSNGCVFITINHSPQRREHYYDCQDRSGTGKGTARVDGDRLCVKWDCWDNEEHCHEVFQIGENQYETLNGAVKYYKLK